MKNILIFILISISTTCNAQQIQKWIEKLENPEWEGNKLKPENKLKEYNKYDFSTLLVPKSTFLGYIGENYRRIEIFFTSITKDKTNINIYNITGTSIVNGNNSDFQGTITLKQIREFQNMHYGVDDKYKDIGIKSQGIAIADYELKENPNQKHTGIFKGITTLWWFVDQNGILHYDNIEIHSDNYKNNQYVGTWQQYGNKELKSCNWGEYRIPFSGDLDMGAGSFSPDPKFHNMGWKDFKEYK